MSRVTNKESIFDPFRTFHTKASPHHSFLTQVNLERIPPFLRALLVTDGTVTRFLEAYLWEPIEVRQVDQKEIILDQDLPWLEIYRGETILKRQVLLHGQVSGKNYTFAESMIRIDQLAKGLRDDLLRGRLGLGELLRDRRMETYRELLSFSQQEAGEISGSMDIDPQESILVRSYRIFHKQVPIILITEKFPQRYFL